MKVGAVRYQGPFLPGEFVPLLSAFPLSEPVPSGEF